MIALNNNIIDYSVNFLRYFINSTDEEELFKKTLYEMGLTLTQFLSKNVNISFNDKIKIYAIIKYVRTQYKNSINLLSQVNRIIMNFNEKTETLLINDINSSSTETTTQSFDTKSISSKNDSASKNDIKIILDHIEKGKKFQERVRNGNKKIKKVHNQRANYSKDIITILRGWLVDNADNPYPSEETKKKLAFKTKLSLNQINNWYVNARRRHLPKIKKHK